MLKHQHYALKIVEDVKKHVFLMHLNDAGGHFVCITRIKELCSRQQWLCFAVFLPGLSACLTVGTRVECLISLQCSLTRIYQWQYLVLSLCSVYFQSKLAPSLSLAQFWLMIRAVFELLLYECIITRTASWLIKQRHTQMSPLPPRGVSCHLPVFLKLSGKCLCYRRQYLQMNSTRSGNVKMPPEFPV